MSSALGEQVREWALGTCWFCRAGDLPVQWCGHLDAYGPDGPAATDLYTCARCASERYVMALADQHARDMAALPP